MPASTSDKSRSNVAFARDAAAAFLRNTDSRNSSDWKNRRAFSSSVFFRNSCSFVRPTPAATRGSDSASERAVRSEAPSSEAPSVADDFSDPSSFETLVASDAASSSPSDEAYGSSRASSPSSLWGEVVCPSTSSPSSSSRTANSSSASRTTKFVVASSSASDPSSLDRSSSPTANAASSSYDRRSLEGSRLRFCGEELGERGSVERSGARDASGGTEGL